MEITTMRQWLINKSWTAFRDKPEWAERHDALARKRGQTRQEYIESQVEKIIHDD